ncbi:Rv3235 family protein [Nocardioides sp.]|jgi:hypothetical protein|uniref:Rv3235 family protein n=1 Tax=Nocardioides sp. TaxID=35761 RepID=UPI0031FEB038|nr:hypothetical protein [Nocardioides sp.]
MSPFHERVVPLRVPVPVASVQGTLALDLQPRRDPPPLTGPDGRVSGDVVPIDLRRRQQVEQWSRRFAQAAVEIVGGDRPVSQLLRWVTTDVYADLGRRAQLVARAGGHAPGTARVQPVRPKVLSVHTCFVEQHVVEAAVHVRYGAQSRALAARFVVRGEPGARRWVCTDLEFA